MINNKIKFYKTLKLLFISGTSLLISCDNSSQENPKNNVQNVETREIIPVKTDSLALQINDTVAMVNQGHYIKKLVFKDSVGTKRVKYVVKNNIIDSLNSIYSIYDTSKYNHLAVSYFTTLADSLHGKPFYAENSDSVAKAIIEILTNKLNDGTDVVFLIDKTGSMEDDIVMVKKSLSLMTDYLSKFNNVKVGLAFYGDKNWHYDMWYKQVELTSDIEKIKSSIDDYATIGNPDVPESVNDGIVKAVTSMNWTNGNKRLMLLIGDAPSLNPPYSDYTTNEVIRKCNSMNVLFNVYPIVIASTGYKNYEHAVDKSFLKLYPNPAVDYINIECTTVDDYTFRIHDANGRTLHEQAFNGDRFRVNISSIPSGSYLFYIMDKNAYKYYSTMLIIQH